MRSRISGKPAPCPSTRPLGVLAQSGHLVHFQVISATCGVSCGRGSHVAHTSPHPAAPMYSLPLVRPSSAASADILFQVQPRRTLLVILTTGRSGPHRRDLSQCKFSNRRQRPLQPDGLQKPQHLPYSRLPRCFQPLFQQPSQFRQSTAATHHPPSRRLIQRRPALCSSSPDNAVTRPVPSRPYFDVPCDHCRS